MLKTILNRQIELTIQLNEAVNFIMYYENLDKEFRIRHSHLNWIFLLSRDFSIITFEKLLGNSDYSYKSIRSTIKDDYGAEELKTFQKLLDIANKFYLSEKIQQLRNTHVAHLDKTREPHLTDWKKVYQLTQLIMELQSNINLLVNGAHLIFSENTHSDRLIHQTEAFSRAESLYFKSKREHKSSVSIDELKSVIYNTDSN